MSEPVRPTPPPFPSSAHVPLELLSLRQWVGWRAKYDVNKDKWRKPPASPRTGEGIGAVEKYQEHFTHFNEAVAGARQHELDGAGFVFTENDPYVGIDFDGAVDNGVIHAAVQTWLKWFVGAYIEFSPSGTGVHVICKGQLARAVTATPIPNDDATCELYSRGRFFTWTSQTIGIPGPEVANCQVGIDKLLSYLGPKPETLPPDEHAPRAMSVLTARKLHETNLEALRQAKQGEGNALLNTAAFFAGRAFTAGALEGTEESLKRQLLDIVTKEWKRPHPEDGARQTITSGWQSGAAQPLALAEDDYPGVAETLEDFNSKFFLVKNFGNKARVCSMELNRIARGTSYTLAAQSIHDFKIGYMNQLVQVGEKPSGEPKFEDRASVWLKHRYRREYEKVVFEPDHETPKSMYNLWRGFAYPPVKGACDRYLAHARDNICQGDEVKYRYLIGWMAHAVRRPNEQGHVAIVIQGLKGVGKNVFSEGFANLWGQHGMVVSDQSRITKNFNAHLRDKCVLICDEAFFAGDRRHEGTLKALITGSTITIEAKGVDAETSPNLLHIIIIGNDAWLVPASYEERRFLVLSCGASKQQDQGYFQAINDQLNSGGYGALLHHLLNEVD